MSIRYRSHNPGACQLLLIVLTLLIICMAGATFGETAPPGRTTSLHAGFLDPNGVDVIGYSAERDLGNKFYHFYTFGFPSLAATGISYYCNYNGSGLAATVGVGIGSVAYTSLVYQLHFAERHVIKLGGGYTTGVAYTGLYPALSYELRFK